MTAVKLTKAQREALALVSMGNVSYRPGRTRGAHSNWTRYSYDAAIGGKFYRRTRSVDALVNAGLADLAGSASDSCPVVLTEAGRALFGGVPTAIGALRVKTGRKIVAANGAHARVVDIDGASVSGHIVFRLAVGDFHFTETIGAYAPVSVLS